VWPLKLLHHLGPPREELALALEVCSATPAVLVNQVSRHGTWWWGTPPKFPLIAACNHSHDWPGGPRGFVIVRTPISWSRLHRHRRQYGRSVYSTASFISCRHLQTHKPLDDLRIINAPKIKPPKRNHWITWTALSSRGYAGLFALDWTNAGLHLPRYKDYAAPTASVGSMAAVLTTRCERC